MSTPFDRLDEIKRRMKRLKPSIFQKLVWMMLAIFAAIIIIAHISYLLGSKYFLLFMLGENDDPLLLILASCGLFALSMAFTIGICCGTKPLKSIILALCFMPIHVASNLILNPSIITSLIIPAIFVTVYNLFTTRKLHLLTNVIITVILFVVMGAYDWAIMPVKTAIKLDWLTYYASNSVVANFFLAFDRLLVMLALYLLRMEAIENAVAYLRRMVARLGGSPDLSDAEKEVLKKFKSLSVKSKARTIVNVILFNLFQFTLIQGLAFILEWISQGIFTTILIMALSFRFFMVLIRQQLHINPKTCSAIGPLIFAIASRFTFSANLSMLFPVVITCIMVVTIGKVVSERNEYNALKSPKPFNCKTATIDEFELRCIRVGLNRRDLDFAKDALSCERLPCVADVATKYYMAEQSTRSKKTRIKKLLETK